MTISEANAVNRLIDDVMHIRDLVPIKRGTLDSDSTCAYLIFLADRANKALHAGWSGDQVRRRWPKPQGWTLPK